MASATGTRSSLTGPSKSAGTETITDAMSAVAAESHMYEERYWEHVVQCTAVTWERPTSSIEVML
jgi:hypothetical protein